MSLFSSSGALTCVFLATSFRVRFLLNPTYQFPWRLYWFTSPLCLQKFRSPPLEHLTPSTQSPICQRPKSTWPAMYPTCSLSLVLTRQLKNRPKKVSPVLSQRTSFFRAPNPIASLGDHSLHGPKSPQIFQPCPDPALSISKNVLLTFAIIRLTVDACFVFTHRTSADETVRKNDIISSPLFFSFP